MYQLIVDSGSTKTDWVVLKDSQIVIQLNSIGFNPYFQTQTDISLEINKSVIPQLQKYLKEITVVHYYGAACSTTENCLIIKEALTNTLAVKEIFVEHDLLAAARALCQREWGIAGILGTGSNSCLYDGQIILENVPSAGYLWADYGGGSQIGKYMMRDYFEDSMPLDIRQAFEASGYNKESILNNVYKKGVPSKYLATVSGFASQHIQHPYIIKLLKKGKEKIKLTGNTIKSKKLQRKKSMVKNII
jgi:N-acetylglucosamine kinase-like BadF-type ATPase